MRREFLSPGPQCKHSRRNRRHNQAFRRRKVPLQCIHLVKKSHKIVFTIKYLKVTKLFLVEIFLRLTVSTLQLAIWADRLVSLEVGKSSLGLWADVVVKLVSFCLCVVLLCVKLVWLRNLLESLSQLSTFAFQLQVCPKMSNARPAGQRTAASLKILVIRRLQFFKRQSFWSCTQLWPIDKYGDI